MTIDEARKLASLTIVLPLPPKCLRANAAPPASRRGHIGVNKAKAKARGDARLATLAALNGGSAPKWDRVKLHATFHLGPQGRHADPSNLNRWLKAYEDGIQDALGINDQHFVWLSPAQFYGRESKERKVVVVAIEIPRGEQ